MSGLSGFDTRKIKQELGILSGLSGFVYLADLLHQILALLVQISQDLAARREEEANERIERISEPAAHSKRVGEIPLPEPREGESPEAYYKRLQEFDRTEIKESPKLTSATVLSNYRRKYMQAHYGAESEDKN